MAAEGALSERIPEPARAPVEHAFEFSGQAGEYFRIWIVNLLLTVLTIGIYSPWAKVRSARYLSASTQLDGASFAYLAHPLAILKGRLMVLGFFAFYAVASFFSVYLETAMSVALFLLIPWAVVRSVAFRAHNTAWRNIRFGFEAGYGPAFGAYIGWPVIGIMTLGLAYPNALFRERRFIVNHARYGTTPFEIGSTNGDFYRTCGLAVLLVLAMAASIALAFRLAGEAALVAAGITSVPFYFLLFGFLSSRITNLTYHGTRLGEHRLVSRVPAAGLTAIYVTNVVAILASLGLLVPWTRIRTARFRCRYMGLVAAGDLDVFAAAQGEEVESVGAELGDALGLDIGL